MTGYATLSEDGMAVAFLLTQTLPMWLAGIPERRDRSILDDMEEQEGKMWKNQKLPGNPPRLPRPHDGRKIAAFSKELGGVGFELGQPSQHRATIGPFERGGIYNILKAPLGCRIYEEDSPESRPTRRLTTNDWVQILKVRSDGWVSVRSRIGGERLTPDIHAGECGWADGKDLLALEASAVWLPSEGGFTREAAHEFGGILPMIEREWLEQRLRLND